MGERIAFSFLESMKYVGDSAVVDILRKGEEKQFEVGLPPSRLHVTCAILSLPTPVQLFASWSAWEGFLVADNRICTDPAGCLYVGAAVETDAACASAPEWRGPIVLHRGWYARLCRTGLRTTAATVSGPFRLAARSQLLIPI